MKDHYLTLHLGRLASEKQIKHAYRELCKQYHPDHNKAPEAHTRMQEINEARRVLSSPLRRAEYDQLLRLQEQQGQPTTDAASASGTTEYCRCEKCGRVDPTLRVTVFTWVVSLLVFTYRHGWAKILCARCRTKYALLFDLQNFLMGWWGIPFGVFWTLQALWHNSLGGQQPEENNALFLAGLGYEFHRKGDLKAAVSALQASLRFKKDPRVEAFYWQTQARFHETPAAYASEQGPSLLQRFATGAFHPAVYCAPMLAILFWLASLWLESENKSPARTRSGAALRQDNFYKAFTRSGLEENMSPGFAQPAPSANANDSSKPAPSKPRFYNLDGTVAHLTPEEEAEGLRNLKLIESEEAGLQLFARQEYTRAFEPLRSAAVGGRPRAQYYLAWCYLKGTGATQDAGEAVKWFRGPAEQGYASAQCSLGDCYFNGNGVTKDVVEAVQWYRKAAEQGYAVAQCKLGICYHDGEGVTKDAVEAVKWYRKAAEQGETAAQCNLGASYFDGSGVIKDAAEAEKWYRTAAEQGLADAQFMLGRCLLPNFNDKGARDAVEAVKWYRKAADQGYAAAQVRLGAYYSQGIGVTWDGIEAVKWYRKAAEQGDATAQDNLGYRYADGDGVPKDYVAAYKWLNLASAQDVLGAKQRLPMVEQLMTPQQIAEAQRLAREFKPRKTRIPDSTSPREGIEDFPPSRSGTGFFITEDGFLITNEHVVGEGSQIRVLTGMGLLVARVVKVDAANDLALLKVEGRFTTLPVATSRTVRLGSTVATVGFPNTVLQGFAPKLAKGEIAALSGPQDDPKYFQISVPVQPGNSGGALVDERGNVVGVVSAKLNARAALAASGALPENVNYAVKSSFLLGFLESVPEVSARLKGPNTKDRKFEDVVKDAEQAAALVLVY